MTRPHKLSLDQRATLAAMWADPSTNQREIARAVGLHHSNLWRYADLLHLPARKWPRTAKQRASGQRVSAYVRALHDRAALRQLARCETYLEAERAVVTTPWRRCPVCQGREWTARPHQHPREAA